MTYFLTNKKGLEIHFEFITGKSKTPPSKSQSQVPKFHLNFFCPLTKKGRRGVSFGTLKNFGSLSGRSLLKPLPELCAVHACMLEAGNE